MKNILVLLIFLTTALYAQTEKTTIAVLDLDPTGISEADARFLSDRLRTELFETGVFIVVEREKMDEILSEQGFQSSGCTSVDCAVEIGRLLNVRQIVAGNIGKIDDLFSIGLRLIDIGSGAIVRTATRDFEGRLSEVLVEVIPEIAGMLASGSPGPGQSPPDTSANTPERRFTVGLKYGWAFLTYVKTLNDEIDRFSESGHEARLENFPQNTAFSVEGKYAFAKTWRLKLGVCLENMNSPWLNEFAGFQSEIPAIKNLTDITLERKYTLAVGYMGVEFLFWQPADNQEWYAGADLGVVTMESYSRYAYSQELIPRSEEATTKYGSFVLRINTGFNYHLSPAFYLGLELGIQLASEFDLSAEKHPENFPGELLPIMYPERLSPAGILLQLSAGYSF